MSETDFTVDDLLPCGWGFVFKVVCAPTGWTEERINNRASEMDPPGTSVNRWEVSEPNERDDDFNMINKLQCPDCRDRTHWLMNC